MSGIFRSNSTTNHHTNESTPNKRFSFSAFCTSPGTLQDVTMENPYGVGYRSPCVSLQPYQGSTSPATQGRSVREFEEQMVALRKENFNLKLRLYFIEESIPGYSQASNSTEGQDTLLKQLIDSKVEMEILRKEIQEKQDVLKDAATAMTHLEKFQKDTECKYQNMIDELNQKIQYMEMEREMEKSHTNGDLMGRSDIPENLNALQRIHELEGLLKQAEGKLDNFQQQITSLDDILAKRDETIREYEDKVKELVFQNAELLESIEHKDKEAANNEAQQLREELQKIKTEIADKCCMIQDLEDKLKSRDQLYDKARLTIQKLMLNIKNQQKENQRLKNSTQVSNVSSNDKEHSEPAISSFECTGLCRSFSDTEALNDLTSLQKQKYDSLMEQKDKTIQSLKTEVKKKTADLQNLVNKELWEKNREIERLNKMLNNKTASPLSADNTSQGDIKGELQQSFSDVEYNKALQRNKLLQRKVDILLQRLGVERQNDALITQLKTELQQARLDAETAEKWRRQCADLCGTLSTRLEELAGFLNSLLKHKDVLGVLAVDKRKAMRRAVDRSLDLSKSLNMTLSVSGLSMIDQSLAELHNLSDILGDIDLGVENKTFNSHEDLGSYQHQHSQQNQSMETLKAENKALKKELDKRRSADIKKERRSLPLPIMTENRESESEAWSEPDRKVSLARIGLEDSSVKDQTSASQHNETDSDFSESNSRSFKARTQERIQQLEQMIHQRDNRILDIQSQLVETDNRLKKENLKVLEVSQEMELLKQRNEELHNDLINIGSQEPSHIHNESMLLQQIDEKSRSLAKIQEEHERLLVESRLAEMQINSMKADMEIIKQTYEEALQQAAEQETQQLTKLKQQMDELLQESLKAKEEEHQQILQRNYVDINLYEDCKQQLAELQRQYIEAQRSIDCLQENEHELRQALVETELSSRNLQKQIDESTLRASKAAMERVKAFNDKLQLEKRVEELSSQISQHESKREQMLKQISHLENQHKTLNERLAKMQTIQSSSKKDDAAFQSGYTSEEVAMSSSTANSANKLAQQLLGEERLQNSSPDLGIESDVGRVSSVELNNVQRPQLKTVELNSTSPNSNESDEKDGLLDSSTENIKPSNVPDTVASEAGLNKKHDCLKVEQENAELRRKLLRTKRAFEDTHQKLRTANQRKAQIEKDIKNQILKTHNVLKNVRSNMENEL